MPSVIRSIHPVSQPPGSNLCRAAVIAMIKGRHSPGVLNQVIAEAQARDVPMDSANRLDSLTGIPALASAFGLSHTRTGTDILAGSELASRLVRRPVGLPGTLTAPPVGTPRHAVAIHGVTGDFSSASSSTALGVDPRGCASINMSFFQLQLQLQIEWIIWQA